VVFAGDVISVQDKYKNVAQIVRTPVIVTCNDSPITRGGMTGCKSQEMEWRDVNKHLNPMYIPHLLKHFDILTNNVIS
jgi:hypothetical protein